MESPARQQLQVGVEQLSMPFEFNSDLPFIAACKRLISDPGHLDVTARILLDEERTAGVKIIYFPTLPCGDINNVKWSWEQQRDLIQQFADEGHTDEAQQTLDQQLAISNNDFEQVKSCDGFEERFFRLLDRTELLLPCGFCQDHLLFATDTGTLENVGYTFRGWGGLMADWANRSEWNMVPVETPRIFGYLPRRLRAILSPIVELVVSKKSYRNWEYTDFYVRL